MCRDEPWWNPRESAENWENRLAAVGYRFILSENVTEWISFYRQWKRDRQPPAPLMRQMSQVEVNFPISSAGV